MTQLTENLFSRCPQKPDDQRLAWLRAVHRDDTDQLKVVCVCAKQFREDVVETIQSA